MTLLAGSTRLHRLHRHASEPSGKKRSINVSLVHMCLPLKARTIAHSDHRRCVVRERLRHDPTFVQASCCYPSDTYAIMPPALFLTVVAALNRHGKKST